MFHTIQAIINQIDFSLISEDRKELLTELSTFIQNKKDKKQEIHLNFICTHNSRRSQFSQVWAQVASSIYNIPIHSYSAGMETTACNERTIESLKGFGFQISKGRGSNPVYKINFNVKDDSLLLYSKTLDEPTNPKSNFAAIMTCDHADETCPIVTGCEARIPIRYLDPKKFDDSPLEKTMYDYRSFEIATEMCYVFSKIN
jgi:arsenate reductase (thioredoxin)